MSLSLQAAVEKSTDLFLWVYMSLERFYKSTAGTCSADKPAKCSDEQLLSTDSYNDKACL